ncbi:MAG: DUF748 domain-containing protein [Bacteroidales bacterium]|nr:DUF748 domain-containing protein [Bacteroidales bacterium]
MKKFWIILLIVIVILIVVRLALPPVIVYFVNKNLSELQEYDGEIDDVKLNLIGGFYTIEQIKITKTDDSIPLPFVTIDEVNVRLNWKALFKGSLVGGITVHNPEINYVVFKKDVKQEGAGEDWPKTVQGIMPFRINQFEVKNGRINYVDYTMSPKLNLFVDSLNLTIANISNINKSTEQMPVSIFATGVTTGSGYITIDSRAAILEKIPDIDLDLKLENVNLVSLNKYLKEYTNTDVEAGTMSLYVEMLLQNGKYEGYIKPIVEDLKFVEKGEKEENKFLESIIDFFAEIFENQPKDQVASRIPFNGSLKETDVGIFPAIWNLLENAFIDAISKSLDFTVPNSNENKKEDEKK